MGLCEIQIRMSVRLQMRNFMYRSLQSCLEFMIRLHHSKIFSVPCAWVGLQTPLHGNHSIPLSMQMIKTFISFQTGKHYTKQNKSNKIIFPAHLEALRVAQHRKRLHPPKKQMPHPTFLQKRRKINVIIPNDLFQKCSSQINLQILNNITFN